MKKFLIIVVFIGCTDKKEPAQQKAEAVVKQYIRKNAHNASSYKPLSFAKLDSIYKLDSSNYEELDMLRQNVVARYNEAQSKAMSATADSLKAELLEINNRMEANKSLSGLKIYHISQGENELGEMVMNRGSFYLDTNFVVNGYVQTEDSLLIERE